MLTDRKLVIQNKRDVSTNTKQIYFRHYAMIQAFRGEIETYPLSILNEVV
jgi:hypothetical protein